MIPPARFGFVLFWCVVIAGSGRATAALTCALVDTTKAPFAALLEAKLLAGEGATWVERTEINRILGERELQSAFGATGGAARASLGALVKADVLVLLRSVKNPGLRGGTLIECVVSETKGGFRLRTTSINSTQDAEVVAGALEDLVKQGLKKYAEKIETVVAVPPFLSEDLSFEFNYLQTAYAKLVEELLLAQPGVLVVELGEAQAIAKELALAGEKKVVRLSKPPLHVIGRYRHDGLGKDRTIRMSLRLLQSETQITLKGVKDLPPKETPAWIVQKTTELLPLVQGNESINAPLFSSEAEAKALADRGRQFQRIGNWPEALALHEASLLLNPDQLRGHQDALLVIRQFLIQLLQYDPQQDHTAERIALAERGYEHLEVYLRAVKDNRRVVNGKKEYDPTLQFEHVGTEALRPKPETPPQFVELKAAGFRRRSETLLRAAKYRALAGYGLGDEIYWEARAVAWLPETEQYAVVRRVAKEWEGVPDLPVRLQRMCCLKAYLEETPELAQLLREFTASGRPDLAEAVKLIRRWIAEGQKELAEKASRRPPEEVTELDPRLELITIRNNTSKTPFWFDGAMPAYAGIDIYWRTGALGAMQTKGDLTDFYVYQGGNFGLKSIVFDGQYIWVASKRTQRALLLMAVDSRGKCVEFSAADGIPEGEDNASDMKLCPLAPGKICVIGFTGRTWVATASLNKNGSRQFEIFFQAREIATMAEEEQLTNPHLAFTPTRVFTLRKPDSSDCRIIVGRLANSAVVSNYPILIDPVAKTVEVTKYKTGRWDGGKHGLGLDAADGMYFYESRFPEPPDLMRIRYPGDEKETLIKDAPEGLLARDQQGLHLIGKKWWLVNPTTGAFQVAVEKPSWFYLNTFVPPGANPYFGIDFSKTSLLHSVHHTSHYGPLVKVRQGSEERFYRLNLPSSAR